MNRRAFIASGTAAAAVVALPAPPIAEPLVQMGQQAAVTEPFMSWLGFCRLIRNTLIARGHHSARVEDFSFLKKDSAGKEIEVWGVRIIEPITGARETLVWEADDFCDSKFVERVRSAEWHAQNVGSMADRFRRIMAHEREAMFVMIPHYWGA